MQPGERDIAPDLDAARGQISKGLGLLGLETSYAKRRMHLGYRRAEPLTALPGLGRVALRGHEFHYASILSQPDAPLARVTDATGAEVPETGSHHGHVTGTFFHLIAPAAT